MPSGSAKNTLACKGRSKQPQEALSLLLSSEAPWVGETGWDGTSASSVGPQVTSVACKSPSQVNRWIDEFQGIAWKSLGRISTAYSRFGHPKTSSLSDPVTSCALLMYTGTEKQRTTPAEKSVTVFGAPWKITPLVSALLLSSAEGKGQETFAQSITSENICPMRLPLGQRKGKSVQPAAGRWPQPLQGV